MVRKWSYLNSSNTFDLLKPCNSVSLKYTFKVFRTTTRFKKYILHPTVFFRKKDSIRKRRSNWLNLNSILIKWSLNYLKLKQLYRFHQNYALLPISRLSLNLSTVLKRSNNIDITPWNSLALVKKFKYFKNPLLFSRKSWILTNDLAEHNNAEYFSSSLFQFEDSINSQLTLKKLQIYSSTYLMLVQTQTSHTLQFLINFYKINILISLLNLSYK